MSSTSFPASRRRVRLRGRLKDFSHLDRPIAAGSELENPIGVAFEYGYVVVADHEYLKSQGMSGIVDNLDQLRHQVGPQPTILLVQNQKPPMLGLVQGSQGKHPQANAENVGHRTALPAKHILAVVAALDPKIDRRRAAFELGVRAELGIETGT